METYLCHITTGVDNGVSAVINRTLDGELMVRRGLGKCVADALFEALGLRSAEFATSEDELETCVAALRGRPVRITVSGRVIRSCGLC